MGRFSPALHGSRGLIKGKKAMHVMAAPSSSRRGDEASPLHTISRAH
nr:hypothetical protein [Candidatus Sigynarchaeum springense]